MAASSTEDPEGPVVEPLAGDGASSNPAGSAQTASTWADGENSLTSSVGIATVPPPSPCHGAWLTKPPSIDEPLLLLEEEDPMEQAAQFRQLALEEQAIAARLEAELAEARAANKSDRGLLEALTSHVEALEQEREALVADRLRLEQENSDLKGELRDHHGIMASDWGQSLSCQQLLRTEEAAIRNLAMQAAELREGEALRAEQVAALQHDAARWNVFCHADIVKDVSTSELDSILEVALPAMVRLHGETRARSRATSSQLYDELEQQLCVVCRDAKKAVLFLPCMHMCVCEGCRGRLRPYRCPICKETIQRHEGRVHF